jgi:hypothetical protein
VRNAAPTGSKRTHLSDENHSRRRQILTAYARLPIFATVYRTGHRHGDDDEPARQRCLTALLNDLDTLRVAMLVLDTRGLTRDAHDRRAIS